MRHTPRLQRKHLFYKLSLFSVNIQTYKTVTTGNHRDPQPGPVVRAWAAGPTAPPARTGCGRRTKPGMGAGHPCVHAQLSETTPTHFRVHCPPQAPPRADLGPGQGPVWNTALSLIVPDASRVGEKSRGRKGFPTTSWMSHRDSSRHGPRPQRGRHRQGWLSRPDEAGARRGSPAPPRPRDPAPVPLAKELAAVWEPPAVQPGHGHTGTPTAHTHSTRHPPSLSGPQKGSAANSAGGWVTTE